jgi:hypothetical protein
MQCDGGVDDALTRLFLALGAPLELVCPPHSTRAANRRVTIHVKSLHTYVQ